MDKEALEKRKKVLKELLNSDFYVPMKEKELAMFLNVTKENRNELKEVLQEMIMDGSCELTAKGKYVKGKGRPFVGVFTSHAKGFGFITVEGEEDDYYVPADEVHEAFHKDTVQFQVLNDSKEEGRRKEARVVKILSHGITETVGTYEESKNFGFVVSDDPKITKDIFIPIEKSMGAVKGHKVVVRLTSYGGNGKKPEGRVTEIIGHKNDPGTDILSIVKAYEIPMEFSNKIMKQVENVSNEVSTADMAGRKDFRDWQMVTIDGEDAKDLDDAVSLTMEGENYRLGVHIADVSNYVQEHSALDEEAKKRGTSVYLVDRVIPMLPHKLCNGICSLNQGVNRLALSCVMLIDPKGKVIDHEICESVICVDRRMSYSQVKSILVEKDEKLREEYQELVPMFERMEVLASILRKRRMKRGSIDFDFPESKILLNEQGEPIEIKPYDRNVATKMIEDFMLIANETVAEDCFWQELPFLYRSHENPDQEKIQKLATFINNFGYALHVAKDEVHPKELQTLLEKIEGSTEEPLIARLTLRSMKQARYTTECIGHFGLAAKYYCHFTSPIRRYPDLQIHRIIKDNLRGRMKEGKREHYEKILPEIAKMTSETERRADEVERETDKLKKVQYMEKRMNQIFEGVISSVTSWGLYIELPNTVEGLVHVTSLKDDFYEFHEDTYELVGEAKNKHYKLGQEVRVRVVGTDDLMRTIDFELVENDEWEKRVSN